MLPAPWDMPCTLLRGGSTQGKGKRPAAAILVLACVGCATFGRQQGQEEVGEVVVVA